jgi:hypothetical protein
MTLQFVMGQTGADSRLGILRSSFVTFPGGFSLSLGRHLKSKFTSDEDRMLIQLVNECGSNDWRRVSQLIVTRNARQCRERWSNYLNPALRSGEWTPEEDAMLLAKYDVFGSKWNKIAQFFENRSDLSLRNRWHRLRRRPDPEDDSGTHIPNDLKTETASDQKIDDIREIEPTRDTPIDQIFKEADFDLFGKRETQSIFSFLNN